MHQRADSSGELTDEQIRDRITFIQAALDDGETYANVWQWGWLGVFAAAVAGGGGLAVGLWDDESKRANYLALSMKSVVSLGTSIFLPLRAASAPGELRALPGDTPEQRRAKLAAAEELLAACAIDGAKKTSWLPHALNVAVNTLAAAGVYLYLSSLPADSDPYRDRWKTVAMGFGLGVGVLTLKILTTPTRYEDDLADYRARFGRPSDAEETLPEETDTTWQIAPSLGGIVVGVQF